MILDWIPLQKGFVTNSQDEIKQTQKDDLIQNLGFFNDTKEDTEGPVIKATV